ncbi:MAG: putative dehydrogenase [Bradymonadia bacterium]|jgi:predicted dehydrogenase
MRWGILGVAEIAQHVAPRINQADRCQVHAVGSRRRDRATAFAQELGAPLIFGDYEQLIACGEIDAVYIPLPNALHEEWTLRALEAGLAVLCEKPLTTHVNSARRVAAAAEAAGQMVMEAFMYRYHPMFDTALRLIAEGRIGAVRSIDAVFTFRLGPETSIVRSAELGGGALLDVGSYCVDAMRRIAGDPLHVAALSAGDAVDDSLVAVMDFGGGVLGRMECSIESDERHRLAVSGTDGTLVMNEPWVCGDEAPAIRIERRDEEPQIIEVPKADTTLLMVQHFAECWFNGTAPRFSLEESIRTAAIVDRLRESSGRRLVFPS